MKTKGMCALLALLCSICAADEEWPRYGGGQADRSRSGEAVDRFELELMHRDIAILRTIDVDRLSPPQVSAMGRVFAVRPAAIRQFRWGRSLAPAGHRLAGTCWYTIWYDSQFVEERVRLTLRIDAEKRVVEEVEW